MMIVEAGGAARVRMGMHSLILPAKSRSASRTPLTQLMEFTFA